MTEQPGRPLLVLGGPGTGKTFFLEQRYLKLVAERGVLPHRILLLCSNRAYLIAARERLVRALPGEAMVEPAVYTWHGLAYHLVTRYHSILGYPEPPVLLTAPEQWGTVRALLETQDPARWPHWHARLCERSFTDEVADFCLRVEQRLESTAALAAQARDRPEWAEVIAFVDVYRAHLKARSRMDYAQLIASAARLLEQDSQVAVALGERFSHVLVDDGQDMGPAHRALLGHLRTENLVVAADPDSGIETYRGAEPDWVYGFRRWFGDHQTVVLQVNHRIGAPLGPALERLARFNDEQAVHRPVQPAEHDTGFECRKYASTAEEVGAIARELRRAHLVGRVGWADMAVLISQPRYLLSPLQRALQEYEVPFQPLQGDRPLAWEPAVRCFLDLVRVALGQGSDRLLADLLTGPLTGMDYAVRRAWEREAWKAGRSLSEVICEAPGARELVKLLDLVREHQDRADECFWQVYSQASFYRQLEARALSDSGDPANEQLDSLVALSRGLERFVDRRLAAGSIGDYLSEASRADFGADPWLAPSARVSGGVAISTFHGAKGREWDIVVVAGCQDAWIPKGHRARGLFDPYLLQNPDAVSRELAAISEDRRTFYVAASRGRRKVIFTAAPSGGGRARPSRFLFELSPEGPVQEAEPDSTPLTLGELSAGLRRNLALKGAPQALRVASVIALAQIPGTDPSGWYGRPAWTAGALPLVEEELRTSYSRLSVYENCGLQYVLQTVLGLDPASSYSMRFGTWIHALFEAWHRGRICDQQALRREYDALFDEAIFPNRTIARQFKRDGLKMLEVFYNHEAETGPNVIAERSFEFPYAGAVLRGRIDRIDRKNKGKAANLTDYKTARWAPSYTQAQSSLQLAIYHLAVRTDPELAFLGEPLLARLVYPGAFNQQGRYQVLNQNAEEAERVIARIPGIIELVRQEDFRPNPRADCHFCKMRPLCPLYPDGQELLP